MWGAFETVGGCEGQGNFTPLRGTEVVATPYWAFSQGLELAVSTQVSFPSVWD